MANLFDKFTSSISDFLHEGFVSGLNDPIRNQILRSQLLPYDREISSSQYYNSTEKEQTKKNVANIKQYRDAMFSEVDLILFPKEHHLATTIKNVIVGSCFHGLTDKKLANIQYRSDNKKLNDLFNKDIELLLKKTNFLGLLKSCLVNDGMNYGEMFIGTECMVGEGIVKLVDNINVKKHIAIYENLEPVGFIKYNKSKKSQIVPEEYISADNISHFMVNTQKVLIEIAKNNGITQELPEKVMCAKPLLLPVVDLIIQYNILEQISTAVEAYKALAPVVLGVGISPSNDMAEITRQIQALTVQLNTPRVALMNNLESLDVKTIVQKMNQLMLIPYNAEEGTNAIRQITIEHIESDLSEKINNYKKTIATAVGIPEGALASTNILVKKEENIATNPNFSRMLSDIQQNIARGIVEFIYKHLKFKYSKLDVGGNPYLSREIDKSCIEVKYNALTNIDYRLEQEQLLLASEAWSSIIGNVDAVTASPNVPFVADYEGLWNLWTYLSEPVPYLTNIFKKDPNYDRDQKINGYGEVENNDDDGDYQDDNEEADKNLETNYEEPKKVKENKDIKTIYK